MNEERIAIVELADELEVRKQRIFKILPRLGIEPTQRREPTRKNQFVATVTRGEAAVIRAELEAASTAEPSDSKAARSAVYADDVGFFYLIQLEPALEPERFKLGFTMDLDGRLQKHRCSAPFSEYHSTWPCRRTWERAAIDCIAQDCEQLHTEVFRAQSVTDFVSGANAFFAMMPTLEIDAGESEA